MPKVSKVLVLGGYGNFGKRISEFLATIPNIQIFISGRNLEKANQLAERLRDNAISSKINLSIETIKLDAFCDGFSSELKKLSVDLVIHTCGPFQGQDFRVPRACIEAGSHYIDLSDDRRFTCQITKLDSLAKEKNLLVLSGASSVPGLSSAVVERYKAEFSQIESIDIAIAPGYKAERGEATIRGILSYTGHPFKMYKQGKWTTTYGWMNPSYHYFCKSLGKRWLADIDVPDLTLFPERYNVSDRVSFKAGLELTLLHLTMYFMAALARIGLVKSWAPMTKLVVKASRWFDRFGTDRGGMQVKIKGKNHLAVSQTINWILVADDGIGPYIPTISANIIAKKLIDGEIKKFGATPCLGLYDLAEFDHYIQEMTITTKVDIDEC